MRIVVAADPWGLELKNAVKAHLETLGHTVIDVGGTEAAAAEYYTVAVVAAKKIQGGEADRAVLCCGTGMGMAIVANKFKGIYASVVESVLAAKLCRAVNDSNVLTLGGLLVTPFIALQAVDAWLATAHTESLEEHTEFLCKALKDIAAIEDAALK
jgi:ribose 5-phosphate isomerase B